jgi:ATP-dependent DNA helicase RecG
MHLEDIKNIGSVTSSKLAKLNITSVKELINFLPNNYVDLSLPVFIHNVEDGQFCLLKLKVLSVGKIVRTKSKLVFFKVVAEDSEVDLSKPKTDVNLIWYNQPYMRSRLKEGECYFVLGKVKFSGNKREIINPSFENTTSVKNLKGIMPIYRTRGIVPQNSIKAYLQEVLKTEKQVSVINERVLKQCEIEDINIAFLEAHFPKSFETAINAQRRIAVEDTVEMLLAYRLLVKNTEKLRSVKYCDSLVINEFIEGLNFVLTESQQKAISEIVGDLRSDKNMNRILAGDVGSGKTVVAFAAMYYAAKSGYQAVLMSPTEILAKQHFRTAQLFFEGLGIKIAFLSSSVSAAQRRMALAEIESGEARIIIGTHSLIQSDVKYNMLSLVVIDEQHRFGVNQKSLIENKATEVDTLTLSATPIPRAIALILYEDLKISTIYKRQINTSIATYIVPDEKTDDMFGYILKEINKGRQAFIVCPRIFDSEGLDIYSAEQLYEKLKTGIYRDCTVGLLHGKLSSAEKDAVMQDFVQGKMSVLISTTVVEVGIDIQNATVMAVLNAIVWSCNTAQLEANWGAKRGGSCFLHTTATNNVAKVLKAQLRWV